MGEYAKVCQNCGGINVRRAVSVKGSFPEIEVSKMEEFGKKLKERVVISSG